MSRLFKALLIALIIGIPFISFAEGNVKKQTKCPVSGNDVNRECFIDHVNKRVYFADEESKQTFIKEFNNRIQEINDNDFYLEDSPKHKKSGCSSSHSCSKVKGNSSKKESKFEFKSKCGASCSSKKAKTSCDEKSKEDCHKNGEEKKDCKKSCSHH